MVIVLVALSLACWAYTIWFWIYVIQVYRQRS